MKKLILGFLIFSGISLSGPGGCLIGIGVSIIAFDNGYYIDPNFSCLIGDLLFPFEEELLDKFKKDAEMPIKEENHKLIEGINSLWIFF